jgi:hypothetical protein
MSALEAARWRSAEKEVKSCGRRRVIVQSSWSTRAQKLRTGQTEVGRSDTKERGIRRRSGAHLTSLVVGKRRARLRPCFRQVTERKDEAVRPCAVKCPLGVLALSTE